MIIVENAESRGTDHGAREIGFRVTENGDKSREFDFSPISFVSAARKMAGNRFYAFIIVLRL